MYSRVGINTFTASSRTFSSKTVIFVFHGVFLYGGEEYDKDGRVPVPRFTLRHQQFHSLFHLHSNSSNTVGKKKANKVLACYYNHFDVAGSMTGFGGPQRLIDHNLKNY